ncbi:peptide/nickel transport system ATP-binding protein [Georgenia satyanarayanai]|uniref:Peptide/nickel transport system ATP-binding protein n=1 Tax=Georgenia satyanarayanai TaxID=860221 RepID=A0A2Y9BUX4_9MICO|nr:ABC transporter ATP-binding protein [Georgenia satyanarayanai]PYG01592.1 peptide/nickel transport system ATP-binding protein [Georgenia satyanarayanai]SSA36392.1 peptide/nickel transport system ATP-binding protein [Georgenia satyanarayanai]
MSPVLEVRDLRVQIGSARIVGGVSWSVEQGQTLGIVGESGSGKSMSVLAATGLVGAPTARVTGQVLLADDDGRPPRDLLSLSPEALRRVRGRGIGFVFQDPATSLNPVLSVERQLTEGLEEHLGMTRRAATTRAVELLELVGIPDPERRLRSFPHELSGGMRQRVMIAIALACEPKVLIADEATTALDVTIQAQILDAVRGLQERLGTATVWISHDLAVVGGLADHVAVMYGGQVLEQADVLTLFRERAHPYTEGLFAARPRLGSRDEELVTIPGSPPDPRALPEGCVFWDRCTVRADERCATQRPELRQVGPGHLVRSFYTTSREAR